jgi:hypothetical protein
MPQATEELRRKWATDGENGGVGEEKAIQFLQSHGYHLQRDWRWKLPDPKHQITNAEYEAMCFLVDEWDFGGIAP